MKNKKSFKRAFISIEVLIVLGITALLGLNFGPEMLQNGATLVGDVLDKTIDNGGSGAENLRGFDPTHPEYRIDELAGIGTDTGKDKIEGEYNPDEPEDVVQNPVTGFDIIPVDRKVKLKPGETAQITAKVLPENADNKNVRWLSYDLSTATVSQAGLITAVAPGTTIVQVQAYQNGKSANIEVTVDNVYLTDFSFNPPSTKSNPIMLVVGQQIKIDTLFTPANTTHRECKFAKVKGGQLVDMHQGASLSITALDASSDKAANQVEISGICETQSGTVTRSIYIETVRDMRLTEDIIIAQQLYEIEVGQTAQILATVYPENATIKTFEYLPVDKTIVSVSADGRIQGLKEGDTFIKVINKGGSVYGGVIEKLVRVNVRPKTIQTTALQFDYGKEQLETGDILTPTITYTPLDASQRELIWTTSNNTIATVDGNGKLSVFKEGNISVRATLKDNPDIWFEKAYQVKGKYIAATSLKILENPINLDPMGTKYVSTEILPKDATNKNLTYSIANTAIATVNTNGLITALKAGVTTLTVRHTDSGLTASVPINVQSVLVQSLFLRTTQANQKALEMTLNTQEDVYLTFTPENASDKTVSIRVENPAIVDVIVNDNYSPTAPLFTVLAKAYGNTKITVTSVDGPVDVIDVEVKKQVYTSITPEVNGIILNTGDTKNINYTVTPKTVDNPGLIWQSANPAVASVDVNGRVTAHKVGETTITIKAKDSNSTASATIKVTVEPRKLINFEVSESIYVINVGETTTINITGNPINSDEKDITLVANDGLGILSSERTLSASNQIAVTVKGLKVGLQELVISGEAASETIIVSVLDGIVKPESIETNDNTSLTLFSGESFQTNVKVKPDDTTDKTLYYSSADESIATVNANGNIRAISSGSTAIRVTSAVDDTVRLVYIVTVLENPLQGVDVSPKVLNLQIGKDAPSVDGVASYTISPIGANVSNFRYELVASSNGEDAITIFADFEASNVTFRAYDIGKYVYKLIFNDIFEQVVTVNVTNKDVPTWDGETEENYTVANGVCSVANGAQMAKLLANGRIGSLPECQTISITNTFSMAGVTIAGMGNVTANFTGNGNTIYDLSLSSPLMGETVAGSFEDITFKNTKVTGGASFISKSSSSATKYKNVSIENLKVWSNTSTFSVVSNSMDGAEIKNFIIKNISNFGPGTMFGLASTVLMTDINGLYIENFGNSTDFAIADTVISAKFAHLGVYNNELSSAQFAIKSVWQEGSITNSYFANEAIFISNLNPTQVQVSNSYVVEGLLNSNILTVRSVAQMSAPEFASYLNGSASRYWVAANARPPLPSGQAPIDPELICYGGTEILESGRGPYEHNEYRYEYVWEGKEERYVRASLIDKTVQPQKQPCLTLNDLNVDSYQGLFQSYQGDSIDLSGWDTSRVVNMNDMFRSSLIGDLNMTGIDTSNVVTMNSAFREMKYIYSINLSGLDLSNVITMESAFQGNSQLGWVNFHGTNTKSLSNINFMFALTGEKWNGDMTGLNTSNLKTMRRVAWRSGASTINITGLSGSQVTDMSEAFSEMDYLYDIKMPGFNPPSSADTGYLLSDNPLMKTVDMTGWNAINTQTLSRLGVVGSPNITIRVDALKLAYFKDILNSTAQISGFDKSKITFITD